MNRVALVCFLLAGCSGSTAAPLVYSTKEEPDAVVPETTDAGIEAAPGADVADAGPERFWSCAFTEGPPNNNSACICTRLYVFSDAFTPGTCPVGTLPNDAGVEVASTTPTSDRCCTIHTDDAGVETCGCEYGSNAIAQCQASGYSPATACPPSQ